MTSTDHDQTVLQAISTGSLPPEDRVKTLVQNAYEKFRDNEDGEPASYIPELAKTDPNLFGISVIDIHGVTHCVGDTDVEFSIQSISKAFVFALILEEIGPEEAREKLGVNNTGLPFDSVIAVELNPKRTMNPMVNAGAIATTSLAPGSSAEEKWEFVRSGLSAFAGRELSLNEEVYSSEAATNQRNRGIARLLEGYGRMYFDALDATDIYTKQCSLNVTSKDLAVMGATLADGGVNPITGKRVIHHSLCKKVLAVLATAGLYELSGDWLYETGLPGKSGVSGGMVTIAPGKGGLGVFAPPLDKAGNSVKGKLVSCYLSDQLGLNLFASRAAE